MKKMTIAIAISTALFLVACGKSNNAETSNPTSATDSMSEQNIPAISEQQANPVDQSTESSTGTSTQTDQAAFEASSEGNEKADNE